MATLIYDKLHLLPPAAHPLWTLSSTSVTPSLAQDLTGELTCALPFQLQEGLQQSQ